MQRDRDEWRQPWPAGGSASPLPSGRGAWTPGARSAVGRQTSAGLTGGLDGAFDVIADEGPRVGTFGRSPRPTSAPPAGGLPVAGLGSSPATISPSEARPVDAPAVQRPVARRSLAALVVVGLVSGVAGAALTLAAVGGFDRGVGVAGGSIPSPVVPGLPALDVVQQGDIIPLVAENVTPSVVRINVSLTSDLTQQQSLGSGVIYRSDGYIITNHHVIEDARGVEVLLSAGERYRAEIVGSDVLNDLAMLRIDRDDLPAIALRPDDEPLRVGETVIAIGSPFGLDATVTAGIISALNRGIRVPGSEDLLAAVLQTDAAINQGNSGGALVDLRGRLVGISTAIFTRSGGNEGIGFAVSYQRAVLSSEQLIAQGFVRYPQLGIGVSDVSAEVAAAFDLTNRSGAVVQSVMPGSGAESAGMRIGDVIVAIDGYAFAGTNELIALVRLRDPGDAVVLAVVRDGRRVDLDVVLGERPRT